ncbi:hypothetical protein MBLNU459_g6764t1 [Dothideomycetes sp. NU459]
MSHSATLLKTPSPSTKRLAIRVSPCKTQTKHEALCEEAQVQLSNASISGPVLAEAPTITTANTTTDASSSTQMQDDIKVLARQRHADADLQQCAAAHLRLSRHFAGTPGAHIDAIDTMTFHAKAARDAYGRLITQGVAPIDTNEDYHALFAEAEELLFDAARVAALSSDDDGDNDHDDDDFLMSEAVKVAALEAGYGLPGETGAFDGVVPCGLESGTHSDPMLVGHEKFLLWEAQGMVAQCGQGFMDELTVFREWSDGGSHRWMFRLEA